MKSKIKLFLCLFAMSWAVQAQSGDALSEDGDYTGQPCRYFTIAAVTNEGTRLNYYPEGAAVMYGTKTYRCLEGSRTWAKIADKPVPEYPAVWARDFEGASRSVVPPDSSSEGGANSQGPGSSPLPGGGSAPDNGGSFGHSTSSGSSGYGPGGASSGLSGAASGEGAQGNRHDNQGGTSGGGVPSSQAPITPPQPPAVATPQDDGRYACKSQMEQVPPPSVTGDGCADNRAAIRYYESMVNIIDRTCPTFGDAQAMAGQLRQLKSASEEYVRGICL